MVILTNKMMSFMQVYKSVFFFFFFEAPFKGVY